MRRPPELVLEGPSLHYRKRKKSTTMKKRDIERKEGTSWLKRQRKNGPGTLLLRKKGYIINCHKVGGFSSRKTWNAYQEEQSSKREMLLEGTVCRDNTTEKAWRKPCLEKIVPRKRLTFCKGRVTEGAILRNAERKEGRVCPTS